MEKYKDFDFETVFDEFHSPIRQVHEKLASTTSIIPSVELQQQRIAELSKIPCSFGLIVQSDLDKIIPVPGVRFPFESDFINDKQFCKAIHPSYLIPFLIFAKFAYEMATRADVKAEQILKASYKIPIPLKLRGFNQYTWFIQNGFALSINQNNQVLSHLNLYEFDRTCLTIANGEIENRFVEASFLIDNNLHEVFQSYLRERISEYLVSLFKKQYKHWKILELLKTDIKLSNQSLARSLQLTEETIKSYSKDILQKLKSSLGYQFVTLREAVISLSSVGYI